MGLGGVSLDLQSSRNKGYNRCYVSLLMDYLYQKTQCKHLSIGADSKNDWLDMHNEGLTNSERINSSLEQIKPQNRELGKIRNTFNIKYRFK